MKDRPILLLAIAQTLIWACLYYSFPALLLNWESTLGWGRADLTAAIALAVFISAFVSPIAGRFIDAGKGPQMMTACAVFGGLFMILLSRVEFLWQFYLLWGLIGVCLGGGLYEPCFALITRARGEQAKRSIIFVTLVAGFAGTISFPVAHSLAEIFGWRSANLVFGLVSIFVIAPVMWMGAHEVERTGKGKHVSSIHLMDTSHSFLRSKVFWFLAIGFSLAAILHGVTIHHLLPILDERGIHDEVAVTAIAFIGPMQVTGRLAMMAAERHISNHGIAISCFVLMGIAILVLFGAGTTPAMLVAFVILFGGSYGMVSIVRPVIARDLLGEAQFGAKSGALALIYLAGSASAPYLGSLLWSKGGYDLVLSLLIILAACGLALYLGANRFARIHSG
ncbi:MAG: MFS transporter [Gammaproteobacteria bacterium]|nr:MFS transporter [Gammaproteobacteria bacterium]